MGYWVITCSSTSAINDRGLYWLLAIGDVTREVRSRSSSTTSTSTWSWSQPGAGACLYQKKSTKNKKKCFFCYDGYDYAPPLFFYLLFLFLYDHLKKWNLHSHHPLVLILILSDSRFKRHLC